MKTVIEEYDIGGIIAIIFALTTAAILLLTALGFATINHRLESLLTLTIGISLDDSLPSESPGIIYFLILDCDQR